jgi:hypothetical protein
MKFRFWIALILIILFSVSMNQLFFDTKKYLLEDKYFRNYLELFAVVITGFIGLIYFSEEANNDVGFLWKLIYIIGAFFLLIIALIDNYLIQISKDGQYRFYAMKSIMTGPIVFLILTIIKRIKN